MHISYSPAFLSAIQDLLAKEKGHVFYERYCASEASGERLEELRDGQITALLRITDLQNKKVLDFGCGTGQSLVGLHSAGARVTGVEPNEARLRIAALRLKEHAIDENEITLVHVTDSRRLPFDDCAFDLCFCNAVLEHIPGDRSPYLKEMWRVLRPGGILSISETPNRLYPYDYHTTELWWVPWMSPKLARAYALLRKRHMPHLDLESMGRRGCTYGEITGAFPKGNWQLIYPGNNALGSIENSRDGSMPDDRQTAARPPFFERMRSRYAHFRRVPFNIFFSEVMTRLTGVPPVAFQKVINNLNILKIK